MKLTNQNKAFRASTGTWLQDLVLRDSGSVPHYLDGTFEIKFRLTQEFDEIVQPINEYSLILTDEKIQGVVRVGDSEMAIEDYAFQNENLDACEVLNWGYPSRATMTQFFEQNDPYIDAELVPRHWFVYEWLLHNIKLRDFGNKTLYELGFSYEFS